MKKFAAGRPYDSSNRSAHGLKSGLPASSLRRKIAPDRGRLGGKMIVYGLFY